MRYSMKNRDKFLKMESWEEYTENRELFKDMSFKSDDEVFAHWKKLLDAHMREHGHNDSRKPKTMHDDYFGTAKSKSDS